MDKALILIGILFFAILFVGNSSSIEYIAYVPFGPNKAGMLVIYAIAVGGLMGFGIRGLMNGASSSDTYNDDF